MQSEDEQPAIESTVAVQVQEHIDLMVVLLPVEHCMGIAREELLEEVQDDQIAVRGSRVEGNID